MKHAAVLGTGYIADWHAQALRSLPGVALVAACDLNSTRARQFAERQRIPAVFGSIDELKAHRPLDAVHVLLPPEHHVEAARTLVEAGLNVLLEKPLGLNAEACAALAERAATLGVQVGVSHNFLFSEVYEALKRDVAAGVLGRIDEVRIVWNKELGQVRNGPFDGWLFRSPENVMLEVGPHAAAHALDLVGPVEVLSVRASRPIDLPNGRRFYRRWRVEAEAGPTALGLTFSFAPGFAEHAIQVRGSLGSATADFERNTYVRHRHTRHGDDLDRSARVADEGRQLVRQARRNLRNFALAKLTRSPLGNPFGASIARSLAAFYQGIDGTLDPRVSARMGCDVVALCEQFGRLAAAPSVEAPRIEVVSNGAPEVLVLGATGFIGRELVRQLTAQGRPARVLARQPGGWASTFDRRLIEVMPGDASRPDDLDRALQGVKRVVHLARGQGKTWDDFRTHDVDVTRRIAEACQLHKIERLIYASSIAAYHTGQQAGTITDDTPIIPSSLWGDPYAKSKAATEELLTEMHRRDGLPVTIVRPGIVLGRGGSPYHFGVGYWSRASTCQFYGDGTNPLPIVLVEDVASALIAALDAEGVAGKSLNLVSAPCLSAREYVAELEQAAQVTFEKVPTPIARFYVAELGKWLVKVLVRHPGRRRPSYREWEARTQRARFDCTRARELLGWSPTTDRGAIIRRGIHEPMAELLR